MGDDVAVSPTTALSAPREDYVLTREDWCGQTALRYDFGDSPAVRFYYGALAEKALPRATLLVGIIKRPRPVATSPWQRAWTQ